VSKRSGTLAPDALALAVEAHEALRHHGPVGGRVAHEEEQVDVAAVAVRVMALHPPPSRR
jgi:hypothetical protein